MEMNLYNKGVIMDLTELKELDAERLLKLKTYYNKILSHAEFSTYSDKIYYNFNGELNCFLLPKEDISFEQRGNMYKLISDDLDKDYNNEKDVPFLSLLLLPTARIKERDHPLFIDVLKALGELDKTPPDLTEQNLQLTDNFLDPVKLPHISYNAIN